MTLSTLGLATQAQASQNSGWIYTSNQSGNVFFDADLNGYPGIEKMTVCDNTSDGRGIRAEISGKSPDGTTWVFQSDPSNDGHCATLQGNWFYEESPVNIVIYEYWGDNTAHMATAHAVA
ncbi:hypothetical protein ABT127_33750 [Streptomyces sp. NPDC001904]|uniref:hypothetical protein n=1 Tax=Streptomyces sp. NPDC001904 TaxID=3154531 RepID=UPI003318C750